MNTPTEETEMDALRDAADRWALQVPVGEDQADLFDRSAWDQALDLGLPGLMAAEDHGGLGLGWREGGAILQVLGRAALALPLAETLVAGALLRRAGLTMPPGVLSLAPRSRGALRGGRFDGELAGVAFGRHADRVLAGVDGQVVMLEVGVAHECFEGASPAGEARDRFVFSDAPAVRLPGVDADTLLLAGALMRTCQAAGAMQAALDLSLDYARERRQFGRPIGQFQAVQQALAQFGSETAAVTCAATAACAAMDAGDAAFAVAAAKLRANLATGLTTATAHQVHAAIGFTREYRLRRSTQRLWSWRSEFGHDAYWSRRLGAGVAARGADAFWADLTST